MPNIAIITDNTAQFSNPNFPGNDLVRVIPAGIIFGETQYTQDDFPKVKDFPYYPFDKSNPAVNKPTTQDLSDIFSQLLRTYNELIVITSSSKISDFYEKCLTAVEIIKGKSAIKIIDSLTISVGLGHLVQLAAEKVATGASFIDTEREIRQQIPHIYTLICSPNLRYLSKTAFLNYSQAVIGEILSMYPIYSMEEGVPKALFKAKNFRNVQEYFQEFIEEYDDLKLIAVFKGIGINGFENRSFKQYTQEIHPNTPFSEHRLNAIMATLFGPKTIGLIVIEKPYTLDG